MFLIAFVALCVLLVPLTGGRLAALAEVRLRWTPAIFGALAIQVLIISVIPSGDADLYRVLHLVSYGVGAVFLFANRRIPGVWLVAMGGALNAIAITANAGVMPASATALRIAGQLPKQGAFENSAALAHPNLPFLGDVFAIPASWPFANVFSIGDVCIAFGAGLVLLSLCHSRLVPRAWRHESPRRGRSRDAAHHVRHAILFERVPSAHGRSNETRSAAREDLESKHRV